VRIEFTQAGGIGYFPRLNKPVTVEVDHLDKAEAQELKRLIEAARFFALPAAIGAPARGAADYQSYVVTVEDGGQRHTVRVLVPVEDPALHDLVRAVQKHVKAARASGRGTPPRPTAGKPHQ
jgi:Emfourin